jgi:non-canonical purine NTP pyrophosphatase (RdgB/HAM1 family)
LESIDLDLDELQSDDPIEVVTDKVRRAYEVINRPLIVEDISAGLDSLNGLPGPFIKYFIKRMGADTLWQLASRQETAACVSCVAAYFDGQTLLTAQGDVRGTIVAPRGEAYGFSSTFVPDGQTQTYAEMTGNAKDSLSHRSLAVAKLLEKMKNTLQTG